MRSGSIVARSGFKFRRSSRRSICLDLLWHKIPCPRGDCTITSGTPIQLPDESSNDVADFQLDLDLIFSDGFDALP